MNIFNIIKKKVRYWINAYNFNKTKEIATWTINDTQERMNYLWIVYDSCRYDSLVQARTPVLDRYSKIYSAWTPGTYTLPAHISFFTGILPTVNEPIPYVNRFHKQLISMSKAGQALDHAKDRRTIELGSSKHDMIHGLTKAGYYTVGSGAATWFAKKVLTEGFMHFNHVRAESAESQYNYVLRKLSEKSSSKPFFAFLNLIETHTPYMHYGADREEYSMQARDSMEFPPREDTGLMETKGKKLHNAQILAAEHLDKILGQLLPQIPTNTCVMIMADHGEAFGEDGFWGHGVYHPTVMNVPMACFMLNGERILEDN